MQRLLIFFLVFFFLSMALAATGSKIIPAVILKAKHHQESSDTSGPKLYLYRNNIDQAGYTQLSQALQGAGVQLQDTSGNGSRVMLSMRGFGSNATSNTLFLVNGIPITNPDLAPPDLNIIPIQDIETIEIISGTESVLYGDQAVGGVINVVTHDELKDKFHLTAAIGSYNEAQLFASFNHHYQNIRYHFSAGRIQTNNYRVHNDYRQNTLLGGLSKPYQSSAINFNFKLSSEYMQYPGALTAQQVRQNRQQASNHTDFFRDHNGLFHLQAKNVFNRIHVQTDIALRNMDGNGVLYSPFTQSRLIYFLKPQINVNYKHLNWTNGFEYENDAYRLNSTFGNNHDTQQKYGLFTLADYAPIKKLNLSLGARAAQQNNQLTSTTENNIVNHAFATTAGARYQVNSVFTTYLRRADNYRFPKADENASSGTGVTALRTQRGTSYETGVEYRQEPDSFNANAYLLTLRDEIAFDPTQTPEQPFGSNKNLAPTERKGFSFSASHELSPHLIANGQYNYVNARFQQGKNSGKRIPLVSENIVRGGLNYLMNEHWNIYTEAIFTGNQYAANDDANISGKMGGYTLFNINLHYTFKQFEAALRINNILNKQYYFYTVYQPSLQSEFFYPAPERNMMFTANYFFE